MFKLEEVKGRLNYERVMVLFDGRRVHSYEELVQLAGQDGYRDRETVELVILPIIEGG